MAPRVSAKEWAVIQLPASSRAKKEIGDRGCLLKDSSDDLRVADPSRYDHFFFLLHLSLRFRTYIILPNKFE